jgi:Tfp pilus assembly protein PilF
MGAAAHAEWTDRYRAGEELLQHGLADAAVREFRLALAERPDEAAILDGLGRAEMHAGRYRAARTFFEKAVQRSDDKVPSQTNLAIVNMSLGDHRRAEQLLQKVLSSDPKNHIARRALAQAFHQQGHHEKAASILEEVLADCKDQTARADLAVVYQALNRPAKALDVLRQTIPTLEKGQARARLYANLGVLYWKTGARKESEAAFQKAVGEIETVVGKNHPDTAWILEQYSHVAGELGRKDEARTLRKRAAEIRSSFAVETNATRMTVDWREIAK